MRRRADARATLKEIGSLVAVRGLCLVEKAVHSFPGKQFIAEFEVIALADFQEDSRRTTLDAGSRSMRTSTASAVVADSFWTVTLIFLRQARGERHRSLNNHLA